MTAELEIFLRKQRPHTLGKFYCGYCMDWLLGDIFWHMETQHSTEHYIIATHLIKRSKCLNI